MPLTLNKQTQVFNNENNLDSLIESLNLRGNVDKIKKIFIDELNNKVIIDTYGNSLSLDYTDIGIDIESGGISIDSCVDITKDNNYFKADDSIWP